MIHFFLENNNLNIDEVDKKMWETHTEWENKNNLYIWLDLTWMQKVKLDNFKKN